MYVRAFIGSEYNAAHNYCKAFFCFAIISLPRSHCRMGRRRIPDHLKKTSSEYPQLAFRLSRKDKVRLLKLADDVADSMNRARKDKEPFVTKGDVFVKALYLGFEKMK